jgi:hypothetical protein
MRIRDLLCPSFPRPFAPVKPRRRRRPPSACLSLQPLEDRTVPSTITWTNRGQSSDHFDDVFGANAPVARSVVDTAIKEWSDVIANFNQAGGGNNLDVAIAMDLTPGSSGGSTSTTFGSDNKPRSASITLGRTGDGSQPWYLNPTLFSSAFLGTPANAFAGTAQAGSPAAGQWDFLDAAAHELGRALGLSANPRVSARCTDSGVADSTAGGGVGDYYVFSGTGGFHALLTSFRPDSGGGSDVHGGDSVAAAGASVPSTSDNGADDLMNPYSGPGRRHLVSRNDAYVLRDALDYTVADPAAALGTFYAVRDETGQLTVRGRQDAASNDVLTLGTSTTAPGLAAGQFITASVALGTPVPGTFYTTPYTALFDVTGLNAVSVVTGTGASTVLIGSTWSPPTSVSGNGPGLTVNVGNGAVQDIRGTLQIGNTVRGTTLVVDDSADPADHRSERGIIVTDSSVSFGGPQALYAASGLEGLIVSAGPGRNDFFIRSTAAGVTTTLNGSQDIHDGAQDSFYVQNLDHTVDDIQGELWLRGASPGNDYAQLYDWLKGGDQTYTYANDRITRTGVAPIHYDHLDEVILYAGTGNNTIRVQRTGPGCYLNVVANGGNDTLVGPDAPNFWQLTGLNSGRLSVLAPENVVALFTDMANLIGGAGDDTFQFGDAAGGGRVSGGIDGGGGTNTLDCSAFSGSVYVNLQTGVAVRDSDGSRLAGSLAYIQNVLCGAGNDILVGAGGNVLDGRGGRNLLIGGGSGSTLLGGLQDLLIAGSTAYDTDEAALRVLRTGWVNVDGGFLALAGDLRTSHPGGWTMGATITVAGPAFWVDATDLAAYWSPATGTHVVSGDILAKYRSLGGPTGFLGFPTSDTSDTGHGGWYTTFEHGTIFWSGATGAHEVHGAILGKYAQLGWETSALGSPTTDESDTARHDGRFNDFQHGTIMWTPATGAHAVYGAIYDAWRRTGFEMGPLGFPRTDELDTARHDGRFNDFQHGTIMWTPALGAHAVWGAIYDAWGSKGFELGFLGFPTSDEADTARHDGAYCLFQGGEVFWSGATGAHEVHGAILAKYASMGWELSVLGFPTSDELPAPGGRISHFQGGSISWSPDRGAEVQVNGWAPYGGGLTIVRGSATVFDSATYLRDQLTSAWNAASGAIRQSVLDYVRGLHFEGQSLYNVVFNPGALDFRIVSQFNSVALQVVVRGNYLKFTSTQPTPLGSWADPTFEVRFDIEASLQLTGPAALRPFDVRVRNLSIDSQGVVADVLLFASRVISFLGGPDYLNTVEQRFDNPAFRDNLLTVAQNFTSLVQGTSGLPLDRATLTYDPWRQRLVVQLPLF